MTPHIGAKKEDVASVVLMPGDPKRAKYVADNFLKDAKLINDVRGMLGFTGYYNDKMVTVMASGMGSGSIGIYSYELYKFYDVDTIIRIGSCGSYSKNINVYDVILASSSYSESTYGFQQNGDAHFRCRRHQLLQLFRNGGFIFCQRAGHHIGYTGIPGNL